MSTPDYIEHTVHSIRPHPRGGFELGIAPDVTDPDTLYGLQLGTDLFTPSETTPPVDNGHGGRVYDGILGDPKDGAPATLTINELAQQRNEYRRMGAAALTTGALHEQEGILWVFPQPF